MKRKLIVLFLAICMLISCFPSMVFATDSAMKNEDNITSEEPVVNEPSIIVEEAPINSNEEQNKEPEDETLEKEMVEMFNSGVDFSSKRLLVKGNSKAIKDEPVIAKCGDVSLIQYESEEDAIKAYKQLTEKHDFVEFDTSMEIASIGVGYAGGDDDIVEMTSKENPFKEIQDIKIRNSEYNVAVIDTGATKADKIVSVIGDNGKDKNGHGQQMIDAIKEYAPNAKILSIKAIKDNGFGEVSSIYSAIMLAIDEKVDIINLSVSALATEDNFLIEEAIEKAQSNGITVVGAAGNNGISADLTIPGRIECATIVGSTSEASNVGKTVDYYVPVESTSLATAIVSGLLASDTLKNYKIVDRVINIKVNGEESSSTTKPTRNFYIQSNGGGGGSSGGSVSGSSSVANNQPIVMVWWDRNGWVKTGAPPTQGYWSYSTGWVNATNGQDPISFWIDRITDKLRTKSGYGSVVYNPNIKGGYDRTNMFKAAALQACRNAIARGGDYSQRARIVGSATTLLAKDKKYWWFNGHSSSDGWAKYYNMFTRPGNANELQNWNDWYGVVPREQFNSAMDGERWYNYVWRMGYIDCGDENFSNGRRYLVIAATDDMPTSKVNIQVKKSFSNNAVVSGNSLYSLQGIRFNVYENQNNARNNVGAVTTLTIGANNISEVRELSPGVYYLVEMGPPVNGVVIPDSLKAANGGYRLDLTSNANVTINIGDTPPTTRYGVHYRYVLNEEGTLPQEVLDTLPVDNNTYVDQSVIVATDPSEVSVKTDDNVTYTFEGWDSRSKAINGSDITFVGTWKVLIEEDETSWEHEPQVIEYIFAITDWDGETELPQELIDVLTELLPQDLTDDGDVNTYENGDTVTAATLEAKEITIDDVTYVFDGETLTVGDDTYVWEGWTPEEDTFGEEGNVEFIGGWHKLVNEEPEP